MTRLLLGRTGDILILLPLLYQDYLASGEKQKLIVAKEYADVLEGCSYVDPLIWEGDWKDVSGAIRKFGSAKTTQVAGNKGVIAQVYAKSYMGQDTHRFCESFEKEIWRLAGRLSDWFYLHPLIFDQRDKRRETKINKELFKSDKPKIIVSASGYSSPFPYRELLIELLQNRFRSMEIVDISDYRAHRLYDILGILEASRVILTIDSAVLHLAAACPSLPVCTIVADSPTPWHGSAYRPQYITYTRYSNFARDAVKILDRIEKIGTPGYE